MPGKGDELFVEFTWEFTHKIQVPLVNVFTQYDRLVRDEGVTNPVRSDDEGQDEDSQKAFEKCLSLENNCAVPQGHKSWSQCCAMQKFQSTTVDITDLIKVTVGILNTE